MIRLFVSPAGNDRLDAAAEFLSVLPAAAELLLVGASREAVDHFARSLATRLQATFGWHRFTLTQLAAHLATTELARRGIAHSTPLGAEAVAARSVFEALEGGELEYFEPVARMPGFVRALASTIAELRLAAVNPGAFEGLGAAGKDLARLLAQFEEQADGAAVADRTVLFRTATESLGSQSSVPFRGWPMLFLDVPISSEVERDFLETLTDSASDALLTIAEGDEGTLRSAGAIPAASRLPARNERGDSSLVRLRSHLFSARDPDEAEPDGEVCFFSAPGEGRECAEMARRMLEQARRGIRFDQMAVLLRMPSTYAALLETAFARAGIPAYFTRGSRRPDPSGRAFLAVLACASEGLSARRFAEYLSLGQVPPLTEAGAPAEADRPWVRPDDEALGPAAVGFEGETAAEQGENPAAGRADDQTTDVSDDAPALEGTLRAPWKWERLLVEAAVIGGKERWIRRLDGLDAELRLKHETLQQEEPGSARVFRLERQLENLGHLRAFALPVISRLAALPVEARWGEWLEHLKGLAPFVLRRPERVLGLLAELEPMERVGPATLGEVRGILQDRLAALDPERPPRDYGRVFVGTPEQARGRVFEIVFVPGLAERILPQRVSEDPILLDELRRKLDRGLRLQDDRVAGERLALRLAAGAARRRIYFSYPRLEVARARQRVPSFYALDVQRATRGKIPRFEQLEAEARREADAALDWPAPVDPARAIDDMEHDLAVLGPLLRQAGGASVTGRARYLLELNACLARSLRARWDRWHAPWKGADGLCGRSEAAATALAPHRLTARPYSVSALQKFAVCPYQFLLSAVHRLEPREDAAPLVQMDPLTRGSIFHRVQADFMREMQQSGSLPVTLKNLSAAQKLLDEIIAGVDEKQRDLLAPAIPQVWRDGIEGIRTDLRGWLQRMAETPGEWLPVHFEFGIGFPPEEGRDPASLKEPVTLPGGYQLHGYVDLIERRTAPSGLRVTDYKSGKNLTREGMVLSGGKVLQPVLYGLMVELALKEPVSEGRLYFCTSVGGFNDRVVELHETTRRRGLWALETVDRAVERAFLVPAPHDGACKWCDFREVCGPYEEIRTARKDQEVLEDLNTLRGLP